MAIGNPITLTSNVASKTISVIATAGQTFFTVTGGYRINQLAVFRNGVRLLDSRDYEARNGTSVTLLSAATVGDALEFQVFDDFRVADAIVSAESEQTISGNLIVSGILTATDLRGSDVTFRHVKATGISTVSDTTQSTSTTTGAMIVSGGLGIAKDLFVGGSMNVAGTLTYEDVTNSETAGVTTTGGLVVTGLGATFGSGVGIADSIYHIDDSNTAIRFPANDTFTVETDGAERLRINSSGEVIVGGSQNGEIYLGNGTNQRGIFTFDGTGSEFLDIGIKGTQSQYGHIRFNTGTTPTERLRITSAGRIGIGTADPDRLLVVAGSDPIIRSEDTDTGNNYAEFKQLAGSLFIDSRNDSSDGTIIFRGVGGGSASEKLRITSAGNIGVGNDNPGYKLHIGDATSQANLRLQSSNSDIALISMISGTSSTCRIEFGDSGDDDIGKIYYDNSDNSMQFTTNTSEKLRVDSSGRVTVFNGGTNQASEFNSGANQFVITNNGSCGLTIDSTSSTGGSIHFADGPSGSESYRGIIEYNHGSDYMSFGTAGDHRLRIDSSGRFLQGKTATKGSTGENVPTFCTEITSSNPNILEIANNGTATNAYACLVLSRSDSTSVNGHTAVDDGDKIGEVCFIGADGSDRFNTAAAIRVEAAADFTANNCPADLILSTNGGAAQETERLRIDSNGNFIFKNGALIENGFHDDGGGLTGNYIHDLATYGNVHFSSTNAAGTFTYNLRITNSVALNDVMAEGDTLSFTLMHATNNTSYYLTQLKIDGTNVTPVWAGGSAPSAATGSGFDVYSFSIMKTGNNAYGIFGTFTNHA